jgi:hypothetical protein
MERWGLDEASSYEKARRGGRRRCEEIVFLVFFGSRFLMVEQRWIELNRVDLTS